MKYVYIGRFQPFHKGHKAVVDLTIKMMKPGDTFTIIIGSADQQETERNPLSASQRREMLLTELEGYPVTISTINDSPYNYDLWIEHLCVQLLEVKSATREDFLANREKILQKFSNICIVGMEGIEEYVRRITKYYTFSTLKQLDLGIKFHLFSELDTHTSVHGSSIRALIHSEDGSCSKRFYSDIKDFVSEKVLAYLKTVDFSLIVYNAYIKGISYAESTGCKYNSCFMTVDNIVFDKFDDKVLLIKRKDNGKLAIPGGFAEPYMNMKDNALRELEEETNITAKMLETAFVKLDEVQPVLVDAPYRDPRSSHKCNFVSAVYVWQSEVNAFKKLLAHVKAGDDAADTVWLSKEQCEDLPAWSFHADHKKIICKLLGWDYFKEYKVSLKSKIQSSQRFDDANLKNNVFTNGN